ncbi:MAG: helix-turn-helix domain-containing protein [Candidatus Coproplasma sp.]
MIIAQRIKELRLECNMTQTELSKLVGCTQSMVARWEKEECEPTASAIVMLSKALNCSCDYLLGTSNE